MDSAARLMPPLADARILIVDDDPGVIQYLGRVLAGYRELRFAIGGEQALEIVRHWLPELVLLDAEMPGTDGFAVCRALKADPLLASVPVIFVTQHREQEVEAAVFELGAADFISKPVTGPALLARVAMQLRLQRMSRLLARQSARDELTGLVNRTRLDEEMAQESACSQRTGQPLALLLADIDAFGAYNHDHGRAEGDSCLRALAQVMKGLCQQPVALAARHGHDAFALLLPETAAADALALGACLSAAVASADAATLSIGLALYEPHAAVPMPAAGLAGEIHRAAEAALNAARAAGGAQAYACHLGGDAADPAPLSRLHSP